MLTRRNQRLLESCYCTNAKGKRLKFSVTLVLVVVASLFIFVQAAPADIVKRYNCGGPRYVDTQGYRWDVDTTIAKGGRPYSKNINNEDIAYTDNDALYSTYRYGQFTYEIPLPKGDYEIYLYFAEINVAAAKERIFSITIQEKVVFNKIDLFLLGQKKNYVSVKLESVAQVVDGILRIGLVKFVNQPIMSALEVKYLKPHLAHAVANGPYLAVAAAVSGKASIRVDGSLSHTHGIGLVLNLFEWRIGTKVVGTGEITTIVELPVGTHTVTLYIKDSGGNTDNESTTITIFPFGYPAIDDIYPTSANMAGGSKVTIYGSGFRVSDGSLSVNFGEKLANRKLYTVINDSKMEVTVPASTIDLPVSLVVITSKGVTNAVQFTYVSGSPIAFFSQKLKNFEIGLPTVLTFDNNSALYIGTADGKIARLKLSDDFTEVKSTVISSVLSGRAILGIAADPMSPQNTPIIYVSHSTLFHGESKSTSGLAINGKVSRIEGSNLDVVVDIITNLPVSDHDHSVNGIEFGDYGEMYVQIGGNTNAGVPGRLSGSHIQKENPLSASTIVAQLADPKFDGNIRYDAADNGNIIGGYGVRVFASGQRNSFDITLHSNGKLYATDNGPNNGFGKRATGCGPKQEGGDPDEPDKLNLIMDKRYYGHPNRKRGEKDKKQCVWRSVNEQSNADFKGPLMTLASSTTGIVEFQTNQFEGQLRHNLIVS
jgi:glucose/arabinose dehydrogenase